MKSTKKPYNSSITFGIQDMLDLMISANGGHQDLELMVR